MSVYIKGIDMPKAGNWKTIRIYYDGTCVEPNWQGDCKYMQGCEAVQVPPHGALVERDVITDAIDKTDWYHQAPNKEMVHGANSAEDQAWYKAQDIYSVIDNAPTVIPASKEKDNEKD